MKKGEFQEFGFYVGCRFCSELDECSRDNFTDKFIIEAIERNGLFFGGGITNFDSNGFVTLNKIRRSTTNSHREVIMQWFIQESAISEFYITPFIDAHYGDFDNVKIEWVKK
jgi:uncharacterized protein YggL (DUF469 family)